MIARDDTSAKLDGPTADHLQAREREDVATLLALLAGRTVIGCAVQDAGMTAPPAGSDRMVDASSYATRIYDMSNSQAARALRLAVARAVRDLIRTSPSDCARHLRGIAAPDTRPPVTTLWPVPDEGDPTDDAEVQPRVAAARSWIFAQSDDVLARLWPFTIADLSLQAVTMSDSDAAALMRGMIAEMGTVTETPAHA